MLWKFLQYIKFDICKKNFFKELNKISDILFLGIGFWFKEFYDFDY